MTADNLAIETDSPAIEWGPIELVGRTIAPGEKRKFEYIPGASTFIDHFIDTAIWVIRGTSPGPTLGVTAGIHGDEINGVEIVRRVFTAIEPGDLAGTLVMVPCVNSYGFRVGSRYLPDRRDLNRCFPGVQKGSLGSRIAFILFNSLVLRFDALVDLHTGSNLRTNLPQIRTDLGDAAAAGLATSFGVGVVLDGRGPEGSLRRAAMDAGVPAVIYEAGETLRFQEHEIARGFDGVRNVMSHLGMIAAPAGAPTSRSRVIEKTRWIRVPPGVGGIFLTERQPGDEVAKGDSLGVVIDPTGDTIHPIIAKATGVIIGMAVPQVVLPGYGLFNIGI